MAATITSEAALCNLALGIIGQKQFLIDNLDENTVEAKVAKNFYATTRDELLAANHWAFATKRVVLADTGETRSGWGFAYGAPADMLKAQRIWNGYRRGGEGQEIPFAKELSDSADSYLILTDQPAAELLYTVQLTKVALYPPSFVAALAAQLAVYFAGALPIKPELMIALTQAAGYKLQIAMAVDAREKQLDPAPDSEWITVR